MEKIRHVSYKHKWATITVVAFLIVTMIIIYVRAQSPRIQARHEAVAMAKKYANLTHEQQFYIYNRQTTYYTVAGTNKKGQKIYVVIPKKGNQVNILAQNKGITADQAVQISKKHPQFKHLLNVGLGYYQDIPVWEVSYENKQNNLCFDLISYKDGKMIKAIQNI